METNPYGVRVEVTKMPAVTVNAVDGTVVTGETLETGGVGTTGWLSSIRKAIKTGLIAILGATDGAAVVTDATGTLQQYLRGLVKLWIAGLAAGEAHIGEVGGRSVPVGDETTRPADTTAYAAGDAIGATVSDTGTTPLRSLAVGRVEGGSGYLTKFRLVTDQVACVAVVRVHFYSVAAPAGAIPGDNVLMTLLYLNKAQRIGQIDMPPLATSTVAGASTAAEARDFATRMQFKCAVADQNIYYRLETLTVFTPASGQKFYLEVASEED